MIQLSPSIWKFSDSCNVYVVKSGKECLLIDAGSGAVADHLASVHVDRVDWILHTHHHRDQCWGTPRLQKAGAKVAVPEYERHLFDNVECFWNSRRLFDNMNDQNTFFSLGTSIRVDATLNDYETFGWKDHVFHVLPAKGHTYGMVSLIAEIDGRRVAFTGDLMVNGGKLYQLHAMEYNYGDMLGIEFTMQSLLALKRQNVDVAFPSHGAPIHDVNASISALEKRLVALSEVGRQRTSGTDSPFAERETLYESKLQRISEHLLWAGPYTCSNFYVVLDGQGHAMLIDYGLSSLGHLHGQADHDSMQLLRFVEHHLGQLVDDFAVREIEMVIPTHIHNDHVCGIPYLRKHFGTKCWALDHVSKVIASPSYWAGLPCVFHKPIEVDRELSDGEAFHWRGFDFRIWHAPGQTEFHSIISGTIDGTRVAFTGDNIFLYQSHGRERPAQTTVLRNSFQLDMHRRCAEVLQASRPELICPGHGDLIAMSPTRLDEYADFIDRKERAVRDLVGDPADHFVDLFWAQMHPYLSIVSKGDDVLFTVRLRNNLARTAVYEARLVLPEGWKTPAGSVSMTLPAGGHGTLDLPATAPHLAHTERKLVTAEILIDGVSQGPICEALVVTRSADRPGPTA